MNDVQLSRYLGWFSLALGGLELFASRRIARALGIGSPTLVRAFGAREIAAGLMVLDQPDTALPVWGRVAGDAMDAAVLVAALGSKGNRDRGATAGALLFVAGAAALDIAVASRLDRRESGALQTARRTRVRSATPA